MDGKGKNAAGKERRKHMLKRYLENGLDGFEEHEILEMFLYCSLHGRNADETSRELISQFKSLWGVMMASYDDLLKVENVNSSTAALICFLKDFILLLKKKSTPPMKIDTLDKIFEYCRDNLYFSTTEEGIILYLDKKYRYVTETRFFSNSPDNLPIDIREIVKVAITKECPNVVIIHTHPNCSAEPSAVDILKTTSIISLFKDLSLNLVDHIIIHDEEMVSMRNTTNIKGW